MPHRSHTERENRTAKKPTQNERSFAAAQRIRSFDTIERMSNEGIRRVDDDYDRKRYAQSQPSGWVQQGHAKNASEDFDDYDRDPHAPQGSSHRLVSSRDDGFGRSMHIGKGPKGYKRSDERIHEDVSEALTQSDIDASDVEVRVNGGEVTLTGTVPTRAMKHAAEDLCEHISGVIDIDNQLRVKKAMRDSIQNEESSNGRTHRRERN